MGSGLFKKSCEFSNKSGLKELQSMKNLSLLRADFRVGLNRVA